MNPSAETGARSCEETQNKKKHTKEPKSAEVYVYGNKVLEPQMDKVQLRHGCCNKQGASRGMRVKRSKRQTCSNVSNLRALSLSVTITKARERTESGEGKTTRTSLELNSGM